MACCFEFALNSFNQFYEKKAKLKPDARNCPHGRFFFIFARVCILVFYIRNRKEIDTVPSLISRYRPSKLSNLRAKIH